MKTLIKNKNQGLVLKQVSIILQELSEILHGVFMVKDVAPRTQDFIMSFGERLSAYIISELLISKNLDAEFLDTRKIIKTDNCFNNKFYRIFRGNIELLLKAFLEERIYFF